MRQVGTWMLVAAVWWGSAGRADACTCLSFPARPCEAYARGEGLLFVATATAKGEYRMRLRVSESLRGDLGAGAEVDVKDFGTAACDYHFVPGRSYLVYASRGQNGLLSVSYCGATKALESAADDLAYIRAAQRGETPTSVVGRVSGYVRESMRDPRITRPLAGVRVTAIGPGRGEAVTDGEGQFTISGLPPGDYEVKTGLRDLLEGHRPKTVPVIAGRCTVFDQIATKLGGIRGRVVDARGGPVVGWAVVALPADDERADDWRAPVASSVTGDDGRYEIRDLFPGRYRLGMDHQAQRRPIDFPWPRIYHPGTDGAARATVVTLREGEVTVVADLALPPPLPPATIRGMLLGPDGNPAIGAQVVLAMKGRGPGTVVETSGACFELPVLRGQRYHVSGFLDDLGAHRHSEVREVVAGEGPDLQLTVDQPGDGGGMAPW